MRIVVRTVIRRMHVACFLSGVAGVLSCSMYPATAGDVDAVAAAPEHPRIALGRGEESEYILRSGTVLARIPEPVPAVRQSLPGASVDCSDRLPDPDTGLIIRQESPESFRVDCKYAPTIRRLALTSHASPRLHAFVVDQAGVLDAPLRGDWVVDVHASQELRLQAFKRIMDKQPDVSRALDGAAGGPVRVERRFGERPVIVVSGKYRLHPLRKDQPKIHLSETNNDLNDGFGEPVSGTFDEFLSTVSALCHVPIINQCQTPRPVMVAWEQHRSAAITDGTFDGGKLRRILRNLSRQTSLDIRVESRRGEVWYLERVPAARNDGAESGESPPSHDPTGEADTGPETMSSSVAVWGLVILISGALLWAVVDPGRRPREQ